MLSPSLCLNHYFNVPGKSETLPLHSKWVLPELNLVCSGLILQKYIQIPLIFPESEELVNDSGISLPLIIY
jgi:hypothetical protein